LPKAPAPIAFAVVSWNTRELLGRCLDSIGPAAQAGRATVTVVDNASTDGSAGLVRSEYPWAELIALDENVGFGAAVNAAAARSRSPWIAVANADIELDRDALTNLLEAGERHPDAGIVAPRLVLEDGTTQHSVYSFPTLGFTVAFNLGAGAVSRELGDRMLLEGLWNPDRPRHVDWAIGAFLLVRRACWDAIGGFAPEHWMYAEDLDLGWRAATIGWRTWFEPSAIVRHHGAAATSQVWGDDRDVRWQRSTYAWMLRRRGSFATRACAVVNTAGAAARAALAVAPALVLGGDWRWRYRANRRWTRLHLDGLLASRNALMKHR
jgi:N-acetylglucosaminyl-diphospho-decaprenol L-rhamnosyltransferase